MVRSITITGLLSVALLATACGQRRYCDPCEQVVKQSYVHKYGLEINKDDFDKRGGHGKVITTQKSGVTIAKNYSNGKLNGETTYTYKHSKQIEKIETYQDGTLVKELVNYTSGSPKYEIKYDLGAPNQYTLTNWYESGNRRSRETFVEDRLVEGDYYTKNNQVESTIDEGNGTRVNRDEYGQLVSNDNFVDGLIAQTIVFYPTGAPKEIIPYHNQKIEGLCKYYLPDGEPERFEEWGQGRKEGVTTLFEDGEKVAEIPFFNGKKNGVEKRLRDEVFVVEEISWTDGQRHGPTSIYIDDRTEVDYYFRGKLVSKHQFEKLTRPGFSS